MCDEKWILYDNEPWPGSVVGHRSSKALPKAKLAPKKGHGLCLVVCCWSDALEISEFHYIWEVCSANSWDLPKTATPAAGVGQQQQPSSSLWQRPIAHCTANASKLEQIGLQRFTLATIFTDRWLIDYHFFKHPNNFLQGKHFHNQQEAENAFQEFITSHQSTDFYVTGIKFFLMAKMCWFLMLLILIIKIFF